MTPTIDTLTSGLGWRISEATLGELDEANGFTRTLGAVGNAALSAMGSSKAQGKLEVNRASTHLWKEFQRFTRGTKQWTLPVVKQFLDRTFGQAAANQLGGLPAIQQFLVKTFGQAAAQQYQQFLFRSGGASQQPDEAQAGQPGTSQNGTGQGEPDDGAPATLTVPQAQTPAPNFVPPGSNPPPSQRPNFVPPNKAAAPPAPAPTAPDPPGAQAPGANATAQAAPAPATDQSVPATPAGANRNDTAAAAQAVMTKPTADIAPGASQGKLSTDLLQAVSAKTPDRTQVMRLVHQLLKNAAAKGKQSPAFKQEINNLKAYQDTYGDKVPELRQIDLSAFTEAQLHQVIGLTRYLIEHRVTTRQGIDDAYRRFLQQV